MFVVTRQRQWPEGNLVVEISKGGIDYVNPDAMVSRYRGEFEEIEDPREAVETGIRIAQQWKKDSKLKIGIALGFTHGCTLPFESEKLTQKTFDNLRKIANKIVEETPKCDHCGEPIFGESYKIFDYPDFEFCREYCAEEFWNHQQAEIEEEVDV